MMAELFEWKCPDCGRVIHSTFEKQFDYNKEQHINFHKRNTSKVEGGFPQTKEEIEKKRKILGGN